MSAKQKKLIEIELTIIAIIAFFAFLLSNILAKHVTDLDELWNYNTARQTMLGLIPYKDISMITTPLLPSLVGLILKIIADELIISKILTAILATAILFFTYRIFVKLLKNKALSFIFVGLMAALYYKYLVLDYNVFILFITLIIVLLELKILDKEIINNNENKNKNIVDNKNESLFNTNHKIINFIIGILAGLAFCTKQTLGLFVIAGVLLSRLLLVRNKSEFTVYLKNTLMRFVGIIIPICILLIYMITTNSINDFINYAIQGIKTFSNSIPYFKLFESGNVIITCLAIIIPIMLLIILGWNIVKAKERKNNNCNTIVLLTYSLIMLIVLYPISDTIHFLIGIYLSIVLSIYWLFDLIKNDENIKKRFNKNDKINDNRNKKIISIIGLTIETFFVLLIIVEGGIYTYRNYNTYAKELNNNQPEHFENLIVDNYLIERIDAIKEYRKSKESIEVIILDAEAVIIDIADNKYYKNYDMFLKGNIGKDGEDGIIEDIKNSNNCIYLIKKQDLSLNWQTPTKVIDYVRDNLERIDEVSIFEAYYKE